MNCSKIFKISNQFSYVFFSDIKIGVNSSKHVLGQGLKPAAVCPLEVNAVFVVLENGAFDLVPKSRNIITCALSYRAPLGGSSNKI